MIRWLLTQPHCIALLAQQPISGSSSSTLSSIESDTKSSSSASSSGDDTSLYPKKVAHSRYRGNDAMPLRHRTHALHRAHLRPLGVQVLLEPLLVGPAFLQHPVQIAAKLPRRGRLGLGLPLRSQQMAIVGTDGSRRQLQRDNDLDEDPFEPAITRLA